MLKELLSLFRADDPMAEVAEDFSQMVDLSRDLTVRAGHILFGEGASEQAELQAIHKADVQINKLQRSIRKKIIAHLILTQERRDVTYCLLIMSLVKDVERLGDYAKNVSEIPSESGGTLPDDSNGAEIRAIREAVEDTYGSVNQVFATSDAQTATELIQRGKIVNRRCDELIARVAASTYDASTTTALVLAARYYKRIESHLLNILSGVVMPLHKLDYFDEDALGDFEVEEDDG
ncbi:MAG: PhoU domain-containing protein [Longimicrobiales bacterium]|nr:PhoU domain-containing protein [Longimicrobiales bacterium]